MLLVETLTIWEAVVETIKAKRLDVNIESDFPVTIWSILEEMEAPPDIFNIVVDICILAAIVRNIKFIYCKRKVNILADSLVKKAHRCNNYSVVA